MRSGPYHFLAWLLFLAWLGFLSACTTAPAKPAEETAASLPIWPSPPAQARIRYLRSITTPKDWGIERSLWRRFIDALTGGGNEHFIRPSGVAQRQRVLYVADPGAQALWILDGEQNQVRKVQRVGEQALLTPVAVALRPDGAVFLADSRLKTVFLLDGNGKLIGIAAQKGLERPAGLAYDPTTRQLYVADSSRHRIVVFDPDATEIRSWGQAGGREGEFNHPTHLALDANGTLLVTDALNFRVQAFSTDGRLLWKFGHHGDAPGDIASPKGVGSDIDGHVFVVDALFDAVQIFDHDGHFLLGLGGRGAQPGQFWLPGGIFINPQNEIYVADAYNQRIQVLTSVADTAKEGKP